MLNDKLALQIGQRRALGRGTFWLILGWIGLVMLIVIVSGCKQNAFHQSDHVLIALLTTTTANIVGLMVIVLRGVFDAPAAKREKA